MKLLEKLLEKLSEPVVAVPLSTLMMIGWLYGLYKAFPYPLLFAFDLFMPPIGMIHGWGAIFGWIFGWW